MAEKFLLPPKNVQGKHSYAISTPIYILDQFYGTCLHIVFPSHMM